MKGARPYRRNRGDETVETTRPGPDQCLVERRFRWLEFPVVRRVAAGFGVLLGLRATRLTDLVLAVSEAAACALCHGASSAVLRLWRDGSSVCCEVRSEPAPLVGQLAARSDGTQAMRLSLLRQVCDYVSVEADTSGVTVRVALTVAAPSLPG
jgi:hypothetical protein